MPKTPESDRDFLTPEEVAKRLGVGKASVYNWLSRKELAYHKLGRLVRIRPADVDVFLAANRVERDPVTRKYRLYPPA